MKIIRGILYVLFYALTAMAFVSASVFVKNLPLRISEHSLFDHVVVLFSTLEYVVFLLTLFILLIFVLNLFEGRAVVSMSKKVFLRYFLHSIWLCVVLTGLIVLLGTFLFWSYGVPYLGLLLFVGLFIPIQRYRAYRRGNEIAALTFSVVLFLFFFFVFSLLVFAFGVPRSLGDGVLESATLVSGSDFCKYTSPHNNTCYQKWAAQQEDLDICYKIKSKPRIYDRASSFDSCVRDMLDIIDVDPRVCDLISHEGNKEWCLRYVSGEVMIPISLFYYHRAADEEIGGSDCNTDAVWGLPFTRDVAASPSFHADVIRLLIRGDLTDEDRARGFETEFPVEGLRLLSAGSSRGGAHLGVS